MLRKLINVIVISALLFNQVFLAPAIVAQELTSDSSSTSEFTPETTPTQTPIPTIDESPSPTATPTPDETIIPSPTPPDAEPTALPETSPVPTPLPSPLMETEIATPTPEQVLSSETQSNASQSTEPQSSNEIASTATPTPPPVGGPPPAFSRELWARNGDGNYTTTDSVILDQVYRAPFQNKLAIRFTKLPQNPGTVMLREVAASFAVTGQVGVAYEVTSTMQGGTFLYDLTLPLPVDSNGNLEGTTVKEDNAVVSYSEDGKTFLVVTNETSIDEASDTITIKNLDHFTIYTISADTNPTPPGTGIYTAIAGPTITETLAGQIGKGTLILNIPAGFIFNTGSNVTATVGAATTGSCSSITTGDKLLELGSEGSSSSQTSTPTTTTITLDVKTASKRNTCKITFSGMQVRPTVGTPLASADITFSGTSNIASATKDNATLTEIAGAVNAGTSTVGASPASVPADGITTSTITVTLKDAFGNPVSGKTVTLSSSRGGTDTISAASGSSNSSGVVTFTVSSTTTGSAIFTAVGNSVTITQTATVTFTDAIAPTAPGTPTTSSPTTDNTPTWSWTAATDDVGIDHYIFYWDTVSGGQTNNSGNLSSATLNFTHSVTLADGTWYGKVKAFDAAGNSSVSGNGSVVIDTTAPGITYNYPTAGGQTVWYNSDPGNAIDIDFIWGGGSLLDHAQRKIGTSSFVNIFTVDQSSDYTSNWDINWASLAEGNNEISLKVTDTAGNTRTDNYANGVSGFLFRKDTVAPTDPTDVASTSHTVSDPSSDSTIDMAWTVAGSVPGATDTLSGVDGYSYSFTNGATDVPDNTTKEAEENATSATSTALADGTWYFHLRTRDNAGNWTSTVHAGPFVVDTTAPVLQSFTSSTSNGTYGPGSDINITATYDDNLADGSNIEVVLDTGVAILLDTISGNTLTGTYTVGSSGQNSSDLTVSSINSQNTDDGVGNVQSSTTLPASNIGDTSNITVDTTSPDTSSLNPTIDPLTGDMYTGGMATVSATVTDSSSSVASVEFKMTDYDSNESSCAGVQDSGDPTLWSCQIDTTTLADSNGGTYEMEILATDSAGNATKEYYSEWNNLFDIDNTSPTTTDSGIDTDWHNSDVVVTLSCDDTNSGCATTYYTTDGSTPTTSSFTGNSITLTSDGEYTIKYFSKDNVGNTESVKAAANTVKIDKTNPVDPLFTGGSHTTSIWSNDNTIDVSWSGADDNLAGVAGYSYEWDTNTSTTPDDVSEGSGTSTTSPVLADGLSHYFHLRTQDNAGNWTSTVHLGPFFIETEIPATPQATPAGGDYTTDQSVTLSSSDSGGSGLASMYYTTDGTTPSNTNGTLYSSVITVDKDLMLKAIAYDNAGNSSLVMSVHYGLAPVISAETTPSVSDTSVTVTWTTDDLSTSRVIYDTVSHPVLGVAPNYGYANSTVEDSAKVTSHSVALSGLSASLTYFYRTVSHGSPETVGSEKTVTTSASSGGGGGGGGGGTTNTSACSDTKPASAPTLLSATVSANSVTLTWSAASDPVSYYLVAYGLSSGSLQYGNPNIGGKGTTSYTVNDLSGGTTYYFKARAGNGCTPGDYSNELSATPTGAFVAGPAAGFTPGVLGAKIEAKEKITPVGEVKSESTSSPIQPSIAVQSQQSQRFPVVLIIIVAGAILATIAGFLIKIMRG